MKRTVALVVPASMIVPSRTAANIAAETSIAVVVFMQNKEAGSLEGSRPPW